MALETAEAERAATADRSATASAMAAGLRGRVESLAERLAEDERRPIARAARKAGGRRLDEDLAVDPDLRAAVEAALADRARAYLVGADRVAGLVGERGRLLVEERLSGDVSTTDIASRRCLDAVAAAGGGRLADAVRRDATGGVRRLLARAVWLPDLANCLAMQAILPPGWVAVARDGSAVIDDVGITLGAADSLLERRSEHARVTTDLEHAEADLATVRDAVAATAASATEARAALDVARVEESQSAADRRRAEEAERAAARESEAVTREAAWHEAQRARSAVELGRLRESVETLDSAAASGRRSQRRAQRAGRRCASRPGRLGRPIRRVARAP